MVGVITSWIRVKELLSNGFMQEETLDSCLERIELWVYAGWQTWDRTHYMGLGLAVLDLWIKDTWISA